MKTTILSLLGALALCGCGGGGGGKADTDPRVAYLNTSPDAASPVFRLDGTAKASDVAFGTVTSFAGTQNKDYDLSLTSGNDPELLVDDAHGFTADADNVVALIGLQTTTTDALAKRLQFVYGTVDRRPLTGSRARIVLLNALVRATGQDQTSVDFRNPGDNPQVNVSGIAYGGFAAREINSSPLQNFEVRQTDTEGAIIASTPLTFAAGHVYLVLIEGQEGASGTTAPGFKVIDVPTRN